MPTETMATAATPRKPAWPFGRTGDAPPAALPIVMLPVRLETRFTKSGSTANALRIRIYPDEIHADSHDESLTEAELEDGVAYHAAIRAGEARARREQGVASSQGTLASSTSGLTSSTLQSVSSVSGGTASSTTQGQSGNTQSERFQKIVDEAEQAAWSSLLSEGYDAGRAAWIVLQTRKYAETRSAADRPSIRTTPFSSVPVARTLPECWVAIGFRRKDPNSKDPTAELEEVFRVSGNVIPEELPLGVSPVASSSSDSPSTEIWITDYDAALKVGMAITVTATEGKSGWRPNDGLSLLLVVGVRRSTRAAEAGQQLGRLLLHHRYDQGLALLPVGVPTNNTGSASAGYSATMERWTSPYLTERKKAPTPSSSMSEFCKALGVPVDGRQPHLSILESDCRDAETEFKAGYRVRALLYPVTVEYALRELFQVASDRLETSPAALNLSDVKEHFLHYLRPLDPCATLRVGSSPYGVLPVAALEEGTSLERLCADLLPYWRAAVSMLPRVNRSPRKDETKVDPEDELAAILGMDGVSQGLTLERVEGVRREKVQDRLERDRDDPLAYHLQITGSVLIGSRSTGKYVLAAVNHRVTALAADNEWGELITERKGIAGDAQVLLKVSRAVQGQNQEKITLQTSHNGVLGARIDLLLDPGPVTAPLAKATSTTEVSLQVQRVPSDYLVLKENWKRTLHKEIYGTEEVSDDEKSGARALRKVHEEAGFRALGTWADPNAIKSWKWEWQATPEHPAVVADYPLGHPALWALLGGDREVPKGSLYSQKSKALLNALVDRSALLADETKSINAKVFTEFRADIERLGATPDSLEAQRWDRHLRATLDACSHRLDAWITSIATRRLEELRDGPTRDSLLGAYAWVEDLRPDTKGNGSQGFIHAPSMEQAAAAAVLRNATLCGDPETQEAYSVELSSRRVRRARWILDGIRAGQDIRALLGMQLERALHDDRSGLGVWIEPLRTAFPMKAAVQGGGDPNAAASSQEIDVTDVIDGLALLDDWEKGHTLLPKWEPASDQAKVEAHVRELSDQLDAITDLLTAEGMLQMVRGSAGLAGSALEVLSRGAAPPDPQIAQSVRTGRTVRNRVILDLPASQAVPNGWATTPRAKAEPALNAWLGGLFGAASSIHFLIEPVRRADTPADAPAPSAQHCTLQQLSIAPIDLLFLARSAEELEARATVLVRDPANAAAQARFAGWDARLVSSLPGIEFGHTLEDALELARSAAEAIGHSRPLRPGDLVASVAVEPAWSDADAADIRSRADSAILEATSSAGASATWNRALEVAGYGVGLPRIDAWNVTAHAERTAELSRRIDAAKNLLNPSDEKEAPDANTRVARSIAALQALFGPALPILPSFVPPALPDSGSSPTAAADAEAWLLEAARVRPALHAWQLLRVMAEAPGTSRPPTRVLDLVESSPDSKVPSEPGRQPRDPVTHLVMQRASGASMGTGKRMQGLVLDSWEERLVDPQVTTGVAFHYDDPGAEAPQAILIALPPRRATEWDLDALVRVLRQTRELTQIRGVTLEYLPRLAQVLPLTQVDVTGLGNADPIAKYVKALEG